MERPERAEQALSALLAGNARYVEGSLTHPHMSAKWRTALVDGQHPSAVIVGCSDSRVAPEVLFDQGLGDLFVVRTAAHVVDHSVLGSIEFAAAQLDVPLVVVLGHEQCGAVRAALRAIETHGHAAGSIEYLVDALAPAARHGVEAPDPVAATVRCHVGRVVQQLTATSTLLADRQADGLLAIVGAVYDLAEGWVRLIAD